MFLFNKERFECFDIFIDFEVHYTLNPQAF